MVSENFITSLNLLVHFESLTIQISLVDWNKVNTTSEKDVVGSFPSSSSDTTSSTSNNEDFCRNKGGAFFQENLRTCMFIYLNTINPFYKRVPWPLIYFPTSIGDHCFSTNNKMIPNTGNTIYGQQMQSMK